MKITCSKKRQTYAIVHCADILFYASRSVKNKKRKSNFKTVFENAVRSWEKAKVIVWRFRRGNDGSKLTRAVYQMCASANFPIVYFNRKKFSRVFSVVLTHSIRYGVWQRTLFTNIRRFCDDRILLHTYRIVLSSNLAPQIVMCLEWCLLKEWPLGTRNISEICWCTLVWIHRLMVV